MATPASPSQGISYFPIFLFVLVETLGISLIWPLMAYLGPTFGLSPSGVGWLQASNAIAQLIAVPIIGALSDTYGRKPLLLVCVGGTLVAFVLLARATTAVELFISRILDGLIGGNVSLASAYIADVTTAQNRSRGMGVIGAAFGVGFIFGPAVGGVLVQQNISFPAYAAALLTFINLPVIWFFLPESLPEVVSEERKKSPFARIFSIVVKPSFLRILLLRLGYLIIFSMFEAQFGFFNHQVLNLTAKQSNYLLSLFAISYALVQGGGIRSLVKRFSEESLLTAALFSLSALFYLYSSIGTINQGLVVLVPLGIMSGIAQTISTTLVTKQVAPALMGSGMGLSASLGSISRITAPLMSGYLIEFVNYGAPLKCCAIICLLSGIFYRFAVLR